MSSVFHDMNFQKTDLNTVRELKEDCWRKARDEELQAFLGFYIMKKGPAKGIKAGIVGVGLILLVLTGELIFEMICKNDPSYNPVPIEIGMIATVLMLLFLACIRELVVRKAVLGLKDCVYVTDAIAYGKSASKVQVMVNGKRIAFDQYQFDEAVSPMDNVYQEDGTYIGFRVLLYVVIENNSCSMKAILGSQAYRHFTEQYKHSERIMGKV